MWWALGITLILVASALAAAFALRGAGPAPSQDAAPNLSVYMSDLPGGLEGLRVTLSSITAGPEAEALHVDVPVVELSALQGPAMGQKVAQGHVSYAAGDVTFAFSRAEGRFGQEWREITLGESLLTIQDALPQGEFGSRNVLFDFDLSASLVVVGEGLEFRPIVGALYQLGEPEPGRSVDLAQDLGRFVKRDHPEQGLGEDREPARRGCESFQDCAPKPSSSGSPSPRSSTPPVSSDAPAKPLVPFNPIPGDGYRRVALAPALAWQGGHPRGDAVTYKVFVDGFVKCDRLAAPSCPLTDLAAGSEHKWRVIARDTKGQETTGSEWKFTTNFAPGLPQIVSPANGAMDTPRNQTLTWTATDADGDALTFTVYLSSNAPPLTTAKCRDIAAAACVTGDLAYNLKYYWQVEASDGMLTSKSAAWEFTTQEDSGHDPEPLPDPLGR